MFSPNVLEFYCTVDFTKMCNSYHQFPWNCELQKCQPVDYLGFLSIQSKNARISQTKQSSTTYLKIVPPHCVVDTVVTYYCIDYAMRWNSLYITFMIYSHWELSHDWRYNHDLLYTCPAISNFLLKLTYRKVGSSRLG